MEEKKNTEEKWTKPFGEGKCLFAEVRKTEKETEENISRQQFFSGGEEEQSRKIRPNKIKEVLGYQVRYDKKC